MNLLGYYGVFFGGDVSKQNIETARLCIRLTYCCFSNYRYGEEMYCSHLQRLGMKKIKSKPQNNSFSTSCLVKNLYL